MNLRKIKKKSLFISVLLGVALMYCVLCIRAAHYESATYIAHFRPNSYTVKFDANGATSGEMEDQEFTYLEKEKLNENKFVRENYKFTGWNTDKNGKGISFSDKADGSTLALEEDNSIVTLYAQWQNQKAYPSDQVKRDTNSNKTGESVFVFIIAGIMSVVALVPLLKIIKSKSYNSRRNP